MHRVNYITMKELTRTINRDLIVEKSSSINIDSFFTRCVCRVKCSGDTPISIMEMVGELEQYYLAVL